MPKLTKNQQPTSNTQRVNRKPMSAAAQRWEREAETSARRMQRGEMGIAEHLSSAPTAHYSVPGSWGKAMPEGLRTRLEKQFGVDLSSIRIHSNAYAAITAEQHGARAFAAGRDLFFGINEYQPYTKEGQGLIAHELAHAVQQLGKTNEQGETVLEQSSGSAQHIQKAIASPITGTSSPPVEDLANLHLGATSDAEARERINDFLELYLIAQNAGDLQTFWNTNNPIIDQWIENNTLGGLPTHFLGFLYDVLKLEQDYDRAASLLYWVLLYTDDLHEFRSVFYSSEAYEALVSIIQEEQGEPLYYWILTVWRLYDVLEPLDLVIAEGENGGYIARDAFSSAILTSLAGQSRSNLTAGRLSVNGVSRSFHQSARQLLGGRNTIGAPVYNELFYAGVWALDQFEQLRTSKITEIAETVAPGTAFTELDLGQRLRIAQLFSTYCQALLDHDPEVLGDTVQDELLAVVDLLTPRMKGVTDFVVDNLQGIGGFNLQVEQGGGFGEFGPARELLLSIIDDEAYTDLLSVIFTNTFTLLALQDGDLPTAGTYNSRREEAARSIGGAIFTELERPFLQQLRQQLRQNREASREEIESRLLGGWLMIRVGRLVAILENPPVYNAANPTGEGQAVAGNQDVVDVRVAHRAMVADWLLSFGSFIQHQPMLDLANSVLRPEEGEQEESYIALLGNWEEVESRSVLRMTEDFDGGTIMRGLAPMTISGLQRFYEIQFYQSLDRNLTSLSNTFDPSLSNYSRAYQATRDSVEMPRKFEMTQVAYSIRSGDEAMIAPLLKSHPKYRSKASALGMPLFEETDSGTVERLPLLPFQISQLERNNSIFFWTLPPLHLLTVRLQHHPIFSVLLQFYEAEHATTVTPPAETVEEGPASGEQAQGAEEGVVEEQGPTYPDWLTWLITLNEAYYWWTTVLSDEQRADFQAQSGLLEFDPILSAIELEGDLGAELDRVHQELILTLRVAARNERRNYLQSLLPPLYDAYEAGRSNLNVLSDELGGGLASGIPHRVLDIFHDATRRLFPAQDRPYHLVAMFLEEADNLNREFRQVENFYQLISFIPQLEMVINLTSEAQEQIGDWPRNENGELAEAPFYETGLLAVLSAEQRENGWLQNNKRKLERLKESLQEALDSQQQQFGFAGRVRQGSRPGFVESVGPGYSINEGDIFTIDGVTWQLREVITDFLYYPGYGTNDPDMTPEDLAGPVLIVKMVGGEFTTPEDKRIAIQEADEIEIFAEDHDLLKEFTDAVQMQAIVSQLEDLADFIEAYVNVGMDIMELTPVGWAVIATRMAGTIAAFIDGGEFDEFIREVQESPILGMDPAEIRDYVFGQVEEAFEPENLLMALFFGSARLFPSRPGRQDRNRPLARRRGVTAKFAKMGRRLANIGSMLNTSLVTVQRTVDFRVGQLQLFFLNHPLISRIFSWLAQNFAVLSSGGIQVAERTQQILDALGIELEEGTTPAEAFQGVIANGADQLSQRITDFLGGMSRIELPNEVLPMDEIIEVVIDLLIERLGTKGEVIARGIQLGLETAGLYDDLVSSVADAFDRANLNPNVFWEENVIPELSDFLSPRITTARDELTTALNGLGAMLPNIDLPTFTAPEGPVQVVASSSFEFEGGEAEGFSKAGINQGAKTQFSGAGAPLPGAIRKRAEGGFGHDFGHVRLHQGSEAKRLTQSAGAEALTSGSHIFLRPNLPYQSGFGRHVLNHELTHVLQHTGARPLGQRHSTKPQTGKKGSGVVLNPAREKEAETTARQVQQGRGSGPVPVRQSAKEGFSPGVSPDFMSRLLNKMVDANELLSSRQDLDTAARNVINLPQAIENSLGPLLNAIMEPFTGSISRATFEDTPMYRAASTRPPVAQLVANARTDLRRVLPAIADRVKRPARSAGTSTGSGPGFELNRSRMEGDIIRYLFARTGVLVKLKLRFQGAGLYGSRHGIPKITGNGPVAELKVRYLNIAKVAYSSTDNRSLWNTLTDSFSFSGYTSSNDDHKGILRSAIRRYVQQIGLSQNIWINSSFTFNQVGKRAVQRIYEEIVRGGGQQLEASDLPPVGQYLDSDGAASPGIGHIGLRLGLHKESNQQGRERESHHMTQYLLMEYFRNDKDHKAFPFLTESDNPYPGLRVNGDKTESFRHGSNTLDILGLGPQLSIRGGDMPAILLARRTHRTGRLHVTGNTAEDFGSSSGDAPSVVVDQWFKNALGTEFSSRAQYNQFRSSQGDAAVSGRIYTAMQTTYKNMRRLMMRQLEPALQNLETDYYNNLAEEANRTARTYEFSSPSAIRVFRAARQFNDRKMGEKGWDHSQGT
ncbi:MAG: DUF4157 domain-containing protein [Bacteroidota bacterium]